MLNRKCANEYFSHPPDVKDASNVSLLCIFAVGFL